ncbi:MAG: hypothetical protein IT443_11095 [Phycisphaeraceae bacterium]|nr:hypothetical protein [Phycisphaeraceae bacterium]
MIELLAKPDFPRTVQRFEAWWLGEVLDRPPVTIYLESAQAYDGPISTHASVREKWLDAEFRVDETIAKVACMRPYGDGFPIVMPNVGPELVATLYGCPLEFSDDSSYTSWSKPIVHDPQSDWPKVLRTRPDFAHSPYWQSIERQTKIAIEKCQGRYIVGYTDIHDTFDTLAALRDPQLLCMDLLDHPDLIAQAAHHVLQGVIETYHRSHAMLLPAGFGGTSWIPCYHQGPSNISCCDFWAMVSPRIAAEVILPTIVELVQSAERSIFHLDGPAAVRHLDLLLSIPQLQAIQYVYGAGNHPVTRWVDVYRRIQAAGKSSQVMCDEPGQALAILEALGPRGLWFTIGQPFASAAEADGFLKEVEHTSAKFAGQIK